MSELVSIIMPSYNTAEYIKESIDSVLAQTYTNWELIIVDDCSTDNTDAVIALFEDKRIRYFKNERNSGAAVSRNRALREAKGRYIAFLDSDDLWVPEKLEKQIDFIKRNGFVFTYTDYDRIDENSQPLNIFCSGPKVVTKKGMYKYCYPGCLTVIYDRNAIGDIQIKDIKKNNDYAMWLIVCKKADCYLLGERLARYRIRKKSISHGNIMKVIKSHYDLFRLCDERLPLVAFWLACRNMFYGLLKKIKYETKLNEKS